MSIKKILAFTGIRSDYDLMSGIYKDILLNEEIEISLIVSGAHLSKTYGDTIKEIEKDRIPILAKIENLLDSDSKSSRVKSLSILMQNCISFVEEYSPDLILYAGDREEVIVAATVGAYLGIPTAHFYGGDHAKDGHVDNSVRHATSKLSTFHFVTNEKSKARLMRMGENPERIFNTGSPSLDKFLEVEPQEKREIISGLTKKEIQSYALLIYHPFFDEEEFADKFFEQILISLKKKNIKAFISYPNTDSGNKKIINVIEKYASDSDFVFYKNLDRDTFVNLFIHSDFLIGNSSMGIYESSFIKKPAINVGRRQRGRLAAENVVFVNQDVKEIIKSIDYIGTDDFKDKLIRVTSPYGEGKSVRKAIEIIKDLNLEEHLLKIEDPLEMKYE